MKMKVTASLNGKVLHSEVFEIAETGDLPKADAAVRAEARKAMGPGPLWDLEMSYEQVNATP